LRDLNLGPDSKKLIDQYHRAAGSSTGVEAGYAVKLAVDMAKMLERWIEVGWCWPDACPATICGGPHVKVRYDFDKTVDVIEPAHKVGTTFPETPYHVITD
jgi:hypothetical protein